MRRNVSTEADPVSSEGKHLYCFFYTFSRQVFSFWCVCCCFRAGQGAGFLCGRDQLHQSGEPQFPDSTELHAPKEMGAQGR